jgi:hypothetical protein
VHHLHRLELALAVTDLPHLAERPLSDFHLEVELIQPIVGGFFALGSVDAGVAGYIFQAAALLMVADCRLGH